jgi:hypothetical protein
VEACGEALLAARRELDEAVRVARVHVWLAEARRGGWRWNGGGAAAAEQMPLLLPPPHTA